MTRRRPPLATAAPAPGGDEPLIGRNTLWGMQYKTRADWKEDDKRRNDGRKKEEREAAARRRKRNKLRRPRFIPEPLTYSRNPRFEIIHEREAVYAAELKKIKAALKRRWIKRDHLVGSESKPVERWIALGRRNLEAIATTMANDALRQKREERRRKPE